MSPTPEETMAREGNGPGKIPRPVAGEEVVISGLSGIFPSSDNVKAFMENLFTKTDMVTDSVKNERWVFNHPEVPSHLGTVNGMTKFDAQFFRVHFKQACTMEPMSRKLLEHAYSAIYDSGINPLQLRGKKVGVFIGSTFSESEKVVVFETIQRNGFGITGCNKSMYANRISYWIDGKGPSYALDQTCASSMACIEHAYRSITTGQCDAAIVGGCNICMMPTVSLNMKRAGFLCMDGKTKSFDKRGDGYVRSDAVAVLFLQKAKDANRIYSEVYHAKSSYFLQSDQPFLPIRQPKEITDFLEAFYSEIDVSPKDVEYVEAHGTGIAEGDSNELKAIGKVFAEDRVVSVGSVKSNMGHSEPVSGICSATKVCLAFEKGEIPANLHYEEPLNDVEAVKDGRIQVLTENTKFNRQFAAMNSFSYSGCNVHVLLKGRYKPKDLERYKTSIPHLVLISGRQDKCVNTVLAELKTNPIDPEEISLLHNIHKYDIAGHLCRGYTILETDTEDKTVSLGQSSEYYSGVRGPLWFMYSGMGSQWAGMGTELMKLPIFAASIEKCRKVLEPKGIDIVNILTNPDKAIYDNILHSFVGIAAVQIGLTDLLREMGIVPDNIIGHSVGELGCAYADGCITAEEMILSAYSRGLVSVQTPLIKGSMAAVGIGYKTVLPMCPPEIEVACHNSSESATISGPADIMKEFVGELTKKGIFAKEVPCSNIAYHSRYIADAGPNLHKYLSEVIPNPKPRTEKWLSTSVPQEKWENEAALYSSAEYHTNNLLNPVLFEETAKSIPSNAVVVEIAPHGLLQAIVKRSLKECTHIPLTRRGHENPVKFFLESIGKLYESGQNPNVSLLYPKIEFPVSTGTPMLSHLVDWEHSESWPVAKYNTKDRQVAASRKFVMSVQDEDYKYLEGYLRNGVNVFPESALLVIVWETYAMHMGKKLSECPVTFRNVKFSNEAIISAEKPLRLSIMIHRGSYSFEISYEDIEIAIGMISGYEKPKPKETDDKEEEEETTPEIVYEDDIVLSSKDIYRMLYLRGHTYSKNLKNMESFNVDKQNAKIKWSEDWIAFIDNIFQVNTVSNDHNGPSIPKYINRLTIDSTSHMEKIEKLKENDEVLLDIEINQVYDTTKCGGVEMFGLVFENKPVVEKQADLVTTSNFISYIPSGELNIEAVLNINLQIIQENLNTTEVKVVELVNYKRQSILTDILEISNKIAHFNVLAKSLVGKADVNAVNPVEIQDTDVFIVHNVLEDERKISALQNEVIVPKTSMILAVESRNTKIPLNSKYFNVISAMKTQESTFILLKKISTHNDNVIFVPIAYDVMFSWVPYVLSELKKTRKVVLVSERQAFCGLYGLVKSLRKEYGNKISLLLIDDFLAPKFAPEADIFREQLQKNLAFNVLKKGQWGGLYSVPTTLSTKLRNVQLGCTSPGRLDSLTWVEKTSVHSGDVVQVIYSGPSVRDVEKITSKEISDNYDFGMDFSGIDSNGERVMGVVKEGALATTVEADPNLLWPVPEHWTLEDAATVPLPYLHAYYILSIKASLIRNVPIFVHGGAGALGQAIIAVALSLNCEVFTTVSSLEKKRFLMKLYPQLLENHIGNSRDTTFLPLVLDGTNKRGCDIVINCTSGVIREASINCAGLSSFFIDINRHDMAQNKNFGMAALCGERSFKAADLRNVFRPENHLEKQFLQNVISEGIANGTVRPLTRVVYAPEEISRAFRLLSLSRHRGRALVRVKDPNVSSQGLHVVTRLSCQPKSAYVIVCSGNDLGVELADFLVKRGARNLVLHFHPNSIDGYLSSKLGSWHNQGVTIKISSENLSTEKGCLNLLRDAAKMGPVHGIFVDQVSNHNADNQHVTQDDYVTKFNTSSLIVSNLDSASRNVCAELNYFVVMAETSTDGPTAYSNSFTERVCRERFDVGFPSLYLQIAALDQYNKQIDTASKIRLQSLNTVFNTLEASLKLKYHNISSYSLVEARQNSILNSIARILGVSSLNDVAETLTVAELGAHELTIDQLKYLLQEDAGLCYSDFRIEEMTVKMLKDIGKNSASKEDSRKQGFGALFSYIDKDECLATEPMIAMPTAFSNATENEEELDPNATYLMMVPGFEGHHEVYSSICERLKVQAMVFQLGPDIDFNSIKDIAMGIMKFMKNRFEMKSKFYLMGYSFGVNVALELAALIEKEGNIGIVFCLDSSPDALRNQLDAYIGDLSDRQLQDTLIEHMYQLMLGEESEKLRADLAKLDDWEQKLDLCVNRLRNVVHYSNQYKRTLINTTYKRIKLARDYKPNFVLDSEIVLFKGVSLPNAKPLPDDYNLSQLSTQPIKIFDLKSEHASAPLDCRISNIVNKHLDNTVLEAFKNKNLCESYLAGRFKIL